jgi:IS5 family transposase
MLQTKRLLLKAGMVAHTNGLLLGEETYAYGDAAYRGVSKRTGAPEDMQWDIAMRPGNVAD